MTAQTNVEINAGTEIKVGGGGGIPVGVPVGGRGARRRLSPRQRPPQTPARARVPFRRSLQRRTCPFPAPTRRCA
eukprot:5943898-Pleurochrysis_carterae.AAC.1